MSGHRRNSISAKITDVEYGNLHKIKEHFCFETLDETIRFMIDRFIEMLRVEPKNSRWPFVFATAVICKTCGGYIKSAALLKDSTLYGHRSNCPVLHLEAQDGRLYVPDYELVHDNVTREYNRKETEALLFGAHARA